jgi:ankyrin repeat protein
MKELLKKLATLPALALLMVLCHLSAPELARLACVHHAFKDALDSLRRTDAARFGAPSPTALNEARLWRAAALGDMGVVQAMASTLPPDRDGQRRAPWSTALVAAAQNAHMAVMQVCLSMGADPNAHNGQPLLLAATHDYDDVAQMLIRQHGSPDMPMAAALVVAARHGSTAVLLTLLDEFSYDRRELTDALHTACLHARLAPVTILLNQNVAPLASVPDPDDAHQVLDGVPGGMLLAAAHGGSADVVMALLRTGRFRGMWVLSRARHRYRLVKDAVDALVLTGDAALVQ